MAAKRWCVLCAILLALLSLLLVLTVVVIDPFEIYHRALFYSPPYDSGTQVYSNAGVAKNFRYDSVIIGSSVTENCTPSVYDAALGGRFVKLCMNGGLSGDHAKVARWRRKQSFLRTRARRPDMYAKLRFDTKEDKKILREIADDDELANAEAVD